MTSKNKKRNRVLSFLTALGMSCSMVTTNGLSVFASEDKAKATLLNEDEHGLLSFVENSNYEDVFIEVPIEPKAQYAFSIDENGKVIQEEIDITELNIDNDIGIENIYKSIDDEIIVELNDDETTNEETEETTENVTLEESIQYTQIIDPNSKLINKGDLVSINASPEDGYSVESIYVLTDSGKAVTYSFTDNIISFVMPKDDVTIRATFTDSISDFTPDDSIMDNFTYIKSNINSDYVNFNKWELMNLITVKQTVVDKSQFDALEKDVTINNFNSSDNDFLLLNSIINFQTFSTFVINVDDDSDYYVAFVNSMQNDDCNVYDYCVAENNNNGIILDGNYYDNNTGILYLKKDNISYLDIKDDTINGLSNAQVQLLNAYNDSENIIHKINVNADESLNMESGIIEVSQYNDSFSIKLNNLDENVKISINGGAVIAENLNLSEDSNNNVYQYISDSNILKINFNSITVNSVEIEKVNANKSNSSIENIIKANATKINDQTNTKPNNNVELIIKSGPGTSGGSYTKNNAQFLYSAQDCSFTSTESMNDKWVGGFKRIYVPNSFYGYGINATTEDSMTNALNAIYKDTNTTLNITSDVIPDNRLFTHLLELKSLKNQDITFSDGTVVNFNFSGNYTRALLQCCHVNNSAYDFGTHNNSTALSGSGNYNFDNEANWGKTDVFFKILDINETTTDNTTDGIITWAIISKVQYGQAGAAIFKSKYRNESVGAIRFEKEFCYGSITGNDAVAGSLYQKAGTTYKLYRGTDINGELVATFVADVNGHFTVTSTDNTLTCGNQTDNNRVYATLGIGTDGKYQLKPGDYYIVETDVFSGFNFSNAKTFKVNGNKVTTISRDDSSKVAKDYPTLLKMSIKKISETNQVINNAEFDLYYSPQPITITDINATYKNLTNINFASDNVYKIAKFTINNNQTNITIGEDKEGTNGYKLLGITGNGDMTFPTAESSSNKITNKDILTNCPLGYYVLIETKAANNHNLEIVNDKPTYYSIECPNVKPIENVTGIRVVDIASLTTEQAEGFKRQKMSYNGEKYIGTDVTNTDVSFEIPNGQFSFSGIKGLSEKSAKLIGNADSTEFYKKFGHLYSVEGAEYSITFKGTTLFGKVYEDGQIWWTITGDSIPANNPMRGVEKKSDSEPNLYKSISGFSAGDTITVSEIKSSKNTYITTKSNTYTFKNGNLEFIGGTDTNTFTNGIDVAAVKATKGSIDLQEGVTLHENTIVHYKNNKTVKITSNMLDEDGLYHVTETDVKNKIQVYTSDLINVNNEDTAQYLIGTKFDVWYNSTVNENDYIKSENWPTYTINENNEKVIDTKKDYMVHIGTIEYVLENGKVVVKSTPIEFNVFDTDGNHVKINGKNATHTAVVDTDNYFKNLPIGAYMVTEIAAPEKVKLGSDITKYIYANSTSSNQSTIYRSVTINNTSTVADGVEISLEKVYEQTVDNIDMSGAEYSIYWTDDDEKAGEYDKLTFTNSPAKTGSYYLVGKFTIVKDLDGKNRGVVSNSVFKEDGWTFAEDETGDKFLKLPQEIIDKYITTRESDEQFCQAYYTNDYIKNNKNNVSDAIKNGDADNNFTAKDLTTFYGPVGHYVIVETKKPSTEFGASSDKFKLDSTKYYKYINGTDNNTTFNPTSIEQSTHDIFKIKLQKTTKSPFIDIQPLEYGFFRIYFYEDTDEIKYSEATNLDELIKNNPPSDVITTTSDNDGIVNFTNSKGLISIASNLGIATNKHYIRGNFIEGQWIEFPSGVAIVKEFKAPRGYKLSDTDTFTLQMPGSNEVLNLGYDAVFSLSEEISDEGNLQMHIKVRAETNDTTDPYKWVDYQKDETIIGTSNTADNDNIPFMNRDNTPDNDTFSFNKKSADTNRNLANVQFKLTMYGYDYENKVDTIYKEWEFKTGTSGLVSSYNTVFKDYDYRPLIDGKRYRLQEIGNDNNSYLLDTGIFEYKKGMNIASLFKATYDEEDTNKTVYNFPMPSIGTKAWDKNNKTHAATIKDGKISVIDTVDIKNIATGNTYFIEGIAMDITDPSNPVPAVDSNGNYIVASAMFEATGTDQVMDASIDIEFEFAGTEDFFKGKTINFYEYIALAPDALAPEGFTSAYDYGRSTSVYNVDNKLVSRNKEFNYVDGYASYSVKVETKEVIIPTIKVVDGKLDLSNKGFIMTLDKTNYICHADPTDANQSISFPTIKTLESDKYTNNHTSGKHLYVVGNSEIDNMVFVNDKVSISNLPKGYYRAVCTVINSENGEILVNRPSYFYCNNEKEYILNINNLSFTANDIDNFYITEILYSENGEIIAQHTDKIDDQTGYIADIATLAQNGIDNSKLVLEGINATVVDTITYKNLNSSDTYRAYGYIVDKETEEVVAITDKVFKADTNNGTVDVTFNFDTTGLDGKTLVVYEYVFNGSDDVTYTKGTDTYTVTVGEVFSDEKISKSNADSRLIAKHYDNGDANQTIYIPHVHTSIAGKTKTVLPVDNVEVDDIVYYDNVLANEDYTLYGFIVDPENDEEIVSMNHTTFTTNDTSGEAKMTFTFNAGKYANKTLVVYEYMYSGKDTTITYTGKVGDKFDKNSIPNSGTSGNITKALVGKHVDSTDEKQTFTIVGGINIAFSKKDTDGKYLAGAELGFYKVDDNKNVIETIEEWTTSLEEPEKVFELIREGNYMFAELNAPEGYAIADPVYITVVVDNTSSTGYRTIYTDNKTEELYFENNVTVNGKHYDTLYKRSIADICLAELPTAGGSGKLPIAGAGVAMMLAGALYFKRKKDDSIL